MKEYDYTWTTSTGQKIQIDAMTESHVKNVLKLLFRQREDYNDSIKIEKKRIIPESRILNRIWDEGRQEEEDEQGNWSEHCRDESYKYNHETGLFDIT